MSRLIAVCCMGVGLIAATSLVLSADDKGDKDEPKYTIKQVMAKAHKGDDSLKAKIAAGNASDEEKKLLVEMYSALTQSKPPKGDAEGWKTKTEAMVKAAKDVAAGKDGSIEQLNKAANCGACHKEHKPA